MKTKIAEIVNNNFDTLRNKECINELYALFQEQLSKPGLTSGYVKIEGCDFASLPKEERTMLLMFAVNLKS